MRHQSLICFIFACMRSKTIKICRSLLCYYEWWASSFSLRYTMHHHHCHCRDITTSANTFASNNFPYRLHDCMHRSCTDNETLVGWHRVNHHSRISETLHERIIYEISSRWCVIVETLQNNIYYTLQTSRMHSDNTWYVAELTPNMLSYSSTLSSVAPTPKTFTDEWRSNGDAGTRTQYVHDVSLRKMATYRKNFI